MGKLSRGLAIGALCSLVGATASAQVVREGSGDQTTVTAVRDQFRTDLGGGVVAGPNGSFVDGTGARREINWDGVPAGFSDPNNLPADFFNVNSPRGAVFATSGTGFKVSANAGNPTATPIEFGSIDATYPGTFESFSAQKIFTAIGSNILDVLFFVPGTATPALTSGFGAIFTDVDLANTTSIEYFGAQGQSLGVFFVPNVAGANETFSFLGVSFEEAVIGRVRITLGNTALGAGILDGSNGADIVALDDFLFAQPVVAVPEPSTVLLMTAGLAALALARRRRQSA